MTEVRNVIGVEDGGPGATCPPLEINSGKSENIRANLKIFGH